MNTEQREQRIAETVAENLAESRWPLADGTTIVAADLDVWLDMEWLLARLRTVEQERDERMTPESGRALIAETNRWEAAYNKSRDELAVAEREQEYWHEKALELSGELVEAEARVEELEAALKLIADLCEEGAWRSNVVAVARAVLAPSQQEEK